MGFPPKNVAKSKLLVQTEPTGDGAEDCKGTFEALFLDIPDKKHEDGNLSAFTKLVYSLPALGLAGMGMLLVGILPKYYTDTLKVSLKFISVTQFAAGTFATVAVIWIGWLSDQINWKYGRRRPILFIFAPIAALGFTLVFFPLASLVRSPAAMGTWFGVFFIVYTCGSAIAGLASASLRIEVTQLDNQRISLFTYTGMLSGLGILIASGLAMMAPKMLGSDEAGINFSGVFFGSFYCVAALALAILAKENPEFWRDPVPLVPAIRRCLENGPWIRYLISGIVNNTMLSIMGLYVFVLDYSLKVDAIFWFGVIGTVYSVLSFLLTPMWYTLINKFNIDKLTAFKATQVFLILHGALAFIGSMYSIWVFILAIVVFSVWISGHIIIDSAMLADCVDYDELRSGQRREGTYVSVSKLPNIFFDVLTKSLPLLVIDSLGYDNTLEDQSEVVLFALRAFIGFTPMLCGTIALIVIWYYPITGTMHERIVENTRILRGGGSAFDPLTGEAIQWRKIDQGQDERYIGGLDMDWIADYFSEHELLLFASASPESALSRILWELIFSCFTWLFSAILTGWQAVVLLLAGSSEMSFFAIAVTSLLMFLFIFDLARLPVVIKIVRQGTDTGFIIDRILEKYLEDHFAMLKPQMDQITFAEVGGNGVQAAGARRRSSTTGSRTRSSTVTVLTERVNASTWCCSDVMAFVGWRMMAYIPVMVLFAGNNFEWF